MDRCRRENSQAEHAPRRRCINRWPALVGETSHLGAHPRAKPQAHPRRSQLPLLRELLPAWLCLCRAWFEVRGSSLTTISTPRGPRTCRQTTALEPSTSMPWLLYMKNIMRFEYLQIINQPYALVQVFESFPYHIDPPRSRTISRVKLRWEKKFWPTAMLHFFD